MGATVAQRLAPVETASRRRVIALLYHDVVAPGEESSSGFGGGDANRYKFDRDTFARHLDAITARGVEVNFTFDDGGVGAIEHTANLLEQRHLRGIFFVTTDRVGTPGFLDAGQIRELHARGHVVGSHSCSHPARMSACTDEQLFDEWHRSCALLATIVGGPVVVASVPGGYYSMRVALAAERAGIRQLYTSEPTRTLRSVGKCEIVGRFSIQQGVSPTAAAALAAADRVPHLRLKAFWTLKKAIKIVGGDSWLRLRRWWLRRAD